MSLSAYDYMMRYAASIAMVVGCILLCQAAGVIGALTSTTGSSPWYQSLHKPSFNPPGWVFAPVWTILYTLMGIVLYLLLRHLPASGPAVVFFAAQLVLNAMWTPVFFGMHQIRLAMVILVMMWMATAGTVVAGVGVSPAGALLLLPYLAWISFAGILNGAIVRLN